MASDTKAPSVRGLFSRNGALSRWHSNYEFRPGQLEMAEAVESALKDNRHLIVEAGTGTGKTLAYLVPAILSGKKVIISTGTKNLQEQLYLKDVPFLQNHFPYPIKVCYMKGRGNYACLQKIIDAEKEPILAGMEEVADFEIIRNWVETTESGDRAEIKTLPEGSTAWAKIDARSEMCSGQKCAQFERCFITKMHQRALESDIIIVNHHLFFADLAVKEEDYGGIIPDYDAVIFDEAHELEDVAGQYFGVSVSNHQFTDLQRDIVSLMRRKGVVEPDLDRILMQLSDAVQNFFPLFGETEGRTGFRGHRAFLEKYEEAYRTVLVGLELLWTRLQLLEHAPEELIPLVRRAQEIGTRLQFWMESQEEDQVYWIDRRGRGVYLQSTPIDVSRLLSAKLFNEIDCVILTSATLAVAGSFDYAQERLGIESARTLMVSGQFDYNKQALLYVARHLPDPRTPGFTAAAADEIIRILSLSRGRAFCLFTSYQQMRQIHDRVSFDIEYPTLLQGTAPRTVLIEEFRRTPNAVLFATSSFWQGVDVQGEQLSCVIIDKLPFAVPSDPVVEARIRNIKQQGKEPFFEYQIPQAAIALKQGFGRLIRSKTDRGVLSLLDNRITNQRYGQLFFDSLPDYGFTTKIEDVEDFFNV